MSISSNFLCKNVITCCSGSLHLPLVLHWFLWHALAIFPVSNWCRAVSATQSLSLRWHTVARSLFVEQAPKKSSKELMLAHRVGKKSRKRQRRLDRAMQMIKVGIHFLPVCSVTVFSYLHNNLCPLFVYKHIYLLRDSISESITVASCCNICYHSVVCLSVCHTFAPL